MKRFITVLTVFTIFVIPASLGFKRPAIDTDYWFLYITSHFEEYIIKYPQQKVYLHFDREEYETGSTIWYKAYIFDDTKKLPDIRSNELYIEMISPTKNIIMNQLLKIENGTAQGDFPVNDSIGTGLYMIRAFTNNMKNFGKDYLFTKEIRIVNPKKIYYNNDFRRTAKKLSRRDEQIDLQFFPEGGYLVDNITTKLAFKAINQNGRSVDFKGGIYSKKGKLEREIKSSHLGMGQIDFTPSINEKYTAIITTNGKKEWKFDLPEIVDKGYVLNVNDKGDYFQVSIQTNIEFGEDPVSKSAYLFIQNGGRMYYKEKIVFESNKIVLDIEKKYFPGGIMHFTLFDGHGKPQCERLAFVKKDDFLKISTNLETKTVGKRDKLEFDIMVTDYNGEPVSTDLSLSVRNATLQTGMDEYSMNIKNYLLLQSDLKGYIENPEYYFMNNYQHLSDIEVLMLTQGWCKFLWNDILKDSIPFSIYPVKSDLNITGRITKYLLDISVVNADVTLTLLNQFNDVLKTKTAKKGKFEFLGLDYYDTIDVLIEAKTEYGKKNVLILIDEDVPLANDFSAFKSFYLDSLMVRRKIPYVKLVDPGPDPSKPEDFKIHGTPDQVIKFDNPGMSSYNNVMDAIKGKVPGLQVGQNGSMIRGPSSIFGSNEPLYLVDGMETDFNGINTVSVNDIDHVEILKGPSAAIYGLQGSKGVIAVYTKKGFYYKRGEIRFKMLGYHRPKEFYSPRYQTNKMNWETPDLRKTVYWNPSIKTDKEGRAHVNFYQSDIIDKFEIVVEGMSKSGQVGVYKYDYQVKEVN